MQSLLQKRLHPTPSLCLYPVFTKQIPLFCFVEFHRRDLRLATVQQCNQEGNGIQLKGNILGVSSSGVPHLSGAE